MNQIIQILLWSVFQRSIPKIKYKSLRIVIIFNFLTFTIHTRTEVTGKMGKWQKHESLTINDKELNK